MLVMLSRFCFVVLLFSIIREVLSIKKGYYSIVAPATIRPGSVFHMSFTLNDFHKSCWFNISLTSSPERKKIYDLEGIEVKPGTTKLVELIAPSFEITRYYGYLEVFGYRGIISEDLETIFFEDDKIWVFIQTDKSKYKPNELVKFRIICIDQLTRPAKLHENAVVDVYDAEYNIIRTLFDVKFVQGVFRSEFQLSEYPILGAWQISVRIGDTVMKNQQFEVSRYVLPKFNVKIYTKQVSIDEDHMVLEISASYFYGEPVKGNLSITMINFYAPNLKLVPKVTRELQIDGKTNIVLNLKKDLQLETENPTYNSFPFSDSSKASEELYKFDIEAIVCDDVDEEQSRTATEIGVYTQPFKLKLQAPKVLDSDPLLNIKVKVFIKDLDDNSIKDTEHPIEIIVGCAKKVNEQVDSDFDIVRVEYKTDFGEDFAMVKLDNKNYSECYLYAEYRRSKSYTQWMRPKVTPSFDMNILTESPREGEELEIKITNQQPIQEFSYEIISRGDIIQSEHVNVPGNDTTYILRLNVTFAMVPKITIYAHLIKTTGFTGQLKDVLIKRAFENSIKISTDNETMPGTSVYINVTTDEESYVGLMGIDSGVLQNLQKNDIFNEDNVNSQLASVNSLNFNYHTLFYGRTGNIITFSNVIRFRKMAKGGGHRAKGGKIPRPIIRIRKLFPETWLFDDLERIPAGGVTKLETTPDSITTWDIAGFSINSDTGLTFTKNTTYLKVFQQFFISMDLPSFVKEGEIIKIPVYISNYMNQDALTNVTIEFDSEDIDVLEHPEAISKPKPDVFKLISVKKWEKVTFSIKPLKQGQYNVRVQAVSSAASDAVQKTLNVKPQGIPYAMSKTYLVHLTEEGIQEDEITIDIPENAVPGSERVEVSVVGDIFRPLMRNLEKLARVPYGNCEDNVRLIVCNSIVLKYLKVLNYSNPSLESKIRQNIELGYQNQLSFKFLDGSFGLFDRKMHRTGNIWETVYSLWALIQTNEFIRIDPQVIERGLRYLQSKQQENGCLKSESGIEDDVKCTAFALMVFLIDEHSRKMYNEVIRKGLAFLYNNTDHLEYSAISVMSAYALLLGKHKKAGDHLKKLNTNSRLTSKQILWTKSDTLQSNLETITGSFLYLFETREIPEQSLLQIVRGLIVSKKVENSITQMVALHAMIAFVEKLSLSRKNLTIAIKDDLNKHGDFIVNSENSQILQSFEISQCSRRLNIQSKGQGFAVVNVIYKYNLIPQNQSSLYFTTYISTMRTSNHLGVLKICLSVHTNNAQHKLTIMEVNLQSGFIFTEKDSQEVENLSEEIKSIQVHESRSKVMIYLEPIANEACIELEVRKTYKVFNSKPGWAIAYGAHDKDLKATESFKFEDF